MLREIVDNVGKHGTPGQDLQNVISVAMLSEGWDAKNVTHIMGLRAFTSQLLCEQVIGRGLRRVGQDMADVTGEDGITRRLYEPEYVNVFGVPLSIFQDVGGGEPPPPPSHLTQIRSVPERAAMEIRWPNILRVDTVVRPTLTLDWSSVEPLKLDPAQTIVTAEIAPALDGIAHLGQIREIDLEKIPEGFRLQHQVFRAVRKAFESMRGRFRGTPEYLTVQLIGIIELFFGSDRLEIPSLFHQDPFRKRILFALNLDLIVQHLLRFVDEQNAERLEPVFDEDSPTSTTAEMRTWYTSKPSRETTRSQISHAVADSTWESYTADALESKKHPKVQSYVKNDHLGFEVLYLWKGSRRRFIPDYLVRFSDGTTLVLEIKGEDSPRNQAKRAALDTWVKAVNTKGGFGRWRWAVAFAPAEIHDILSSACSVVSKAPQIGNLT